MDGGGAGPPYQLEGVEGYMAPGSPPGSARTLHQHRVRQHSNNCHQQVRRDTITDTDEPYLRHLNTLSADEHSIEDDLRSISLQSRGCAIQENDRPTRVVNQPYIFRPSGRKLGRARHRSIRLTRKRHSFTVRLLEARPRGGGIRLPSPELDGNGPRLRLFMEFDSPCSTKDSTRQGPSNGDNSLLAQHIVVPNNIGDGDLKTDADTPEHGSSAPGNSPHVLARNPLWSLAAWNIDGNK